MGQKMAQTAIKVGYCEETWSKNYYSLQEPLEFCGPKSGIKVHLEKVLNALQLFGKFWSHGMLHHI